MNINASTEDLYLSPCLEEIPRLLSLMNRNSFSKNYGSFSRSFWLHRTSDFPSSIHQMGFHSLALLWDYENVKNPYCKNETIFEWSRAGVEYCLRQQKADGSFDEWYPNERGWAGPTGYILHALCDTYRILEKEMDEAFRLKTLNGIRKSAHLLINGWETDVLNNHIAMALLPLYESYTLLGDESILKGYEVLFEKFLNYNSREGWGLEYDGFDPGYETATLSFLGRLHKINKCKKIESLVEKSLNFISYFHYPDGSFGNRLGSRQTSVNFVFAAEYWKKIFPQAQALSEAQRNSIRENKTLLPRNHEDHYLIYRIPEFLEAAQETEQEQDGEKMMVIGKVTSERREFTLPCHREPFESYFAEGKLFIKNTEKYYLCVNLSRGGFVQFYSKHDANLNFHDCGWTAETKKRKILSSSSNSNHLRVDVGTGRLFVSGEAQEIKDLSFTPLTMIAFRLFMILFAKNETISRKIKSFIRNILMFGNKGKSVRFSREISFGEEIKIRDEIYGACSDFNCLRVGGNFETRLVPQSRYFQFSDLDDKSLTFDQRSLAEKHDKDHFIIERIF